MLEEGTRVLCCRFPVHAKNDHGNKFGIPELGSLSLQIFFSNCSREALAGPICDLSLCAAYNGGQAHKQIRAALRQFRALSLGLLQDGDVGVGVFPEHEKMLGRAVGYCGNPTLRTNSANRGSERRGSNRKSVFKLTRPESRS